MHRKVIIFDFGQVLTLNQKKQVYTDLLRDLHLTPETFFPIWGSYRHAYDQGLLNTLEYWTKVLGELQVPDFQTYVDQNWQNLLATDLSAFDNPRIEMLQYVQELGNRGIPLGILSNMPKDVGEFWESRWDGMDYFTWKLWSGDFGLIKPEQPIYTYLLDTIQREPKDVLFLDDIEANVQGAKTLGIYGVLFTTVESAQQAIEDWLTQE